MIVHFAGLGSMGSGMAAPLLVDADYTARSAVDIWPKDLGIVAAIAAEAGLLPVVETALAQFRAASARGMGREDDAAIAKLVARTGGIALPGGTS